MQHEYGASYPTIIKVLARLESGETIARYNKGYMVPSRKPHMSFSRIAFVGSQHAFRNKELLRICENCCREKGIAIDFVVCREKGGMIELNKFYTNYLYDPAASGSLIGFVFIPCMQNALSQKVLKHISQYRKPVAILQKDENQNHAPSSARHSLFHTIAYAAAEQLSAAAARYFLGCGHRCIAFICSSETTSWEKRLLAGLKNIYHAAGIDDGVICAPAEPKINGCNAAAKSGAHSFESLVSRFTQEQRITNDTNAPNKSMLQTFHRLLHDGNATAWLCSTDAFGLAACAYLQKARIKVPGHISVAGFGDTVEAVSAGLTSFNFNYAASIHAAINHLLSYGQSFPAYSAKKSVIDASIIERDSSGKAPGGSRKVALICNYVLAPKKSELYLTKRTKNTEKEMAIYFQ
jgi:DNA-binding LacI/PurR family transcriptional regulator